MHLMMPSIVFFLALVSVIIICFLFTLELIGNVGENVRTCPLSIISDNLKVGAILLAIYLVYSFYLSGFAFAELGVDNATKVEPTGQVIYCFSIDRVEGTVSTNTTEYHYENIDNPILLKQVYDPDTDRPYLEEVTCIYRRFPMEASCKGFIFHSMEKNK